MKPVAAHDVGEDARLGEWMKARNIHPSELEVYDWLTAMKDGYEPAPKGQHNVSTYKRGKPGQPGAHPNLVAGGFNTKTGERVSGSPLAKNLQELISLGWEPKTAQQLWESEAGTTKMTGPLDLLKKLFPHGLFDGQMEPGEEELYPPYNQPDLNYPNEPAPRDVRVNMHTANMHPGQARPGANHAFFGRPRDIELMPPDPNYPTENLPESGLYPRDGSSPRPYALELLKSLRDKRYPQPRRTDIRLPE